MARGGPKGCHGAATSSQAPEGLSEKGATCRSRWPRGTRHGSAALAGGKLKGTMKAHGRRRNRPSRSSVSCIGQAVREAHVRAKSGGAANLHYVTGKSKAQNAFEATTSYL